MEYSVSTVKSGVFPHISNEQSEKEIKKTTPFSIESKKKKTP